LRDLGRPEHIFQVTHPELEDEFPALSSMDAFPGNLPVQLTAFIGRVEDLAAVTKLLDRSRVVTLTGPGGVGKTRLAVQAAADAIGQFPDGAWFVDLGPISDPGLVAAAVASAMGLPERRRGTIEDALIDTLARQRSLIVLDNCEHVIEAATKLVDLLAHHCANTAVVTTSREALGLGGEATYPVKPLPVPPPDGVADPADVEGSEAVRLFVERAASARHGFELTRDNAAVVGELCRRLDGIPLAIELAAARVQSMSPADILERLNERFRLLGQARRAGLARHQTLRGAVDWSYGLLDPAERLVFARLSVFAGGFTLDAAEAVAAGDGVDALDVVDLVSGLVAKSMVTIDESGTGIRYGVLETLREYGADRLAEVGQGQRLRERHAKYYLALAETAAPHIIGSEQDPWSTRLDNEYDNLRTALAWSQDVGDGQSLTRLTLALKDYWIEQGYWREGLAWCEPALAVDADADPDGTAELQAAAGHMAISLARWDQGRELLQASITSSNTAGVAPVPLAFDALAIDALEANQPDTALRYAEASVEAARRRDEPFWNVYTLTTVSLMTSLTGDDVRGTELADAGLQQARQLRNGYVLTHALVSAGIARYRRDPVAAIPLFDEAIVVSPGGRDPQTGSQARFFRGISHLQLGELGKAFIDLRDYLVLARATGNEYFQAMALAVIAGLLAHDGNPDLAIHLLAVLEQLRAESRITGAPIDLAAQRRIRERLEQKMPTSAFATIWSAGKAMSLDDAVTRALAELDDLIETTR
jgi:predicted ATPase